MFLLKSTKLRRKLLTYAFTHTCASCYVRELAGLISEDPGNLSRELASLEKEGLFTSARKGNLKFYSMNKDYPLYRELKEIIFRTCGVEGSLRELVNGFKGIKDAFIYGSFAKNKENEESDINLFIIGKINENELISKLLKIEQRLNRDIDYVNYTEDEFKRKLRQKDAFISKVINERIIALKGGINAYI